MLKGKTKKVLFIPDQHFPYNDKKYWKVLMKAIKHWKPHTLVVLGDFLDCYCVSFHNKNPNRINLLDKEIEEAKVALRQLEDFTFIKKLIYIAGNHEDRLERYLMSKAPELYNVVKIQELLKLEEWYYVPYRKSYTIGKLHITHDVGRCGKYAAYRSLDDFQDNLVFAHTHRAGVVYGGNVKGLTHVCGMFGWGGDLRHINYMHEAVAKREWQQGFGIAHIDSKGNAYLNFVPVLNGKTCIEGKLLEA